MECKYYKCKTPATVKLTFTSGMHGWYCVEHSKIFDRETIGDKEIATMEFIIIDGQVITYEQVSNLLTCAFEGGSSWCEIVGKREPESWVYADELPYHTEGGHWLQDYPLNPKGALVIHDRYDPDKTKYYLYKSLLERGLHLMASLSPKDYEDLIFENEDAITGDKYLQYCLFGEPRYIS